MSVIQEKLNKYLEINKHITDFRKKVSEYKKTLVSLENEIQEYMKDNDLNTLDLKEGKIILYDRKISQSFKKQSISDLLKEKLKCDNEKAQTLAESILTNKTFKVEKKLKVKQNIIL
jgi:hypothetical protein